MDLLSQRYASPFLILDEFIRLRQLHEFSVEILKTIAEERIHNARWEYYIHKVWDMSFEDYVKACEKPKEVELSHEEIGDIISKSKMMLKGFKPE